MEEEFFPFETSMDSFLHSNFISTERESALIHQQDVRVDDDEKKLLLLFNKPSFAISS